MAATRTTLIRGAAAAVLVGALAGGVLALTGGPSTGGPSTGAGPGRAPRCRPGPRRAEAHGRRAGHRGGAG